MGDEGKPAMTVTQYGPVHRYTPEDGYTRTETCNVRSGTGCACSLEKGHPDGDPLHSWQRPFPRLSGR
jgi:hypothetical protein